jgi:Zn-dependent alcohol dehydrogenase
MGFAAKILTGSWYGQAVPDVDIPHILELYMAGKLDLDSLVTGIYPLERINEAFAALKAGTAIRSIITF